MAIIQEEKWHIDLVDLNGDSAGSENWLVLNTEPKAFGDGMGMGCGIKERLTETARFTAWRNGRMGLFTEMEKAEEEQLWKRVISLVCKYEVFMFVNIQIQIK